MKNKHLHIPAEMELQKLLFKRVNEDLQINQKKSNRIIISRFMFWMSLTTVAYASLYLVHNPLLFILCFSSYGFIVILFALNFGHDFSHNTIFRRKCWNNIGFTFIFTLAGAHAEAWKQRHIKSHHLAPNVEGHDSDLEITSLIRLMPGSKRYWFHSFQHMYAPFLYSTYSLFWIFIKDFVMLFTKDKYTPNKNIWYHLVFWIQKVAYLTYLLILPVLFSHQPISIIIAGFLAMHLFQSVFLLFTFIITHHVETTAYPALDAHGSIASSWFLNQVNSSNDFHPFSPVANAIFGGFNCHIAHHLFPNIHHIHYPKLNKILYATLRQNGIHPNHTTYFGGVRSHLKLLRRMGQNAENGVKLTHSQIQVQP